MAASYSQQKPDDVTLKEAHAQAVSQWENTMARVSRLKVS